MAIPNIHDKEFTERDHQYLDLPADYIKTLKILADRYQETYGIFMEKGYARLETVKPGSQRKYVFRVEPSSQETKMAKIIQNNPCTSQAVA